MSLIPDISNIPYNSHYNHLTPRNINNIHQFVKLKNNTTQEQAIPFNVENLNHRYYLFLNDKNIVEYVGNDPMNEIIEDETEINNNNKSNYFNNNYYINKKNIENFVLKTQKRDFLIIFVIIIFLFCILF